MSTITIVGAGIAGLALAATIDPARHDVTLIERNNTNGEVPTAFGIWPFALEALDRRQLAEPLRQRGLLLNTGVITLDSARRRAVMTREDANTWLITRPELRRLLDEAVPASVHRIESHVTDPSSLDGELVIAADGARSAVRAQIWGDAPRNTGAIAVRGVLMTPPDTPLDRMHEFWGDGKLFGFGPNPMPHGVGTNWYAAAYRALESPREALAWARESFTDFPGLASRILTDATVGQTLVNDILESPHPKRLVRDRYVLIGDAAHAMAPNLGRGACEAMVDAIVLGEALNRAGLDGVRHYEKSRLKAGQRTRRASAMARRVALSARASRMIALTRRTSDL